MAIIYPRFLRNILDVHEGLQSQISYPFFDSACRKYEALRSSIVDGIAVQKVLSKYGLTEYEYRKGLKAFQRVGVSGLIGLDVPHLMEELNVEIERMVFVLKKARSSIPATKMVLILKGFNLEIPISRMRHLYASHGWALGTKPYEQVDFWSLNLKVIGLSKLHSKQLVGNSFFRKNDKLQTLIEVFRTIGERGITKRYPGSRVSFKQHKESFLSLGLLGLVDRARPPFRNSKLGFEEEGKIVLSKIQKPKKDEAHYLKILSYKKITVSPTCITNIFTRWKVNEFSSKFKGELERFLDPDGDDVQHSSIKILPDAAPLKLDLGFISFVENLQSQPTPLASPGIFLFLPYLDRLKIYEKSFSILDLDSNNGYSWFSLLLLNIGRIIGGISSISKACRKHELSLPLMAGLVSMPCKDTFLNKIASIGETDLLQSRQYLTFAAKKNGLIEGKRIAFDFKMRDFTGDDVELKNIGKGPSPVRKVCFPGFRPHLAWDVDTGAPIALEFRNGKARATTTIKRYIRELLKQSIGTHDVERVYLDSEYTAEHVWQYIVDSEEGLGADLTMCIKRNKRVKKYIDEFLETNPTWIFFDEDHTYTKETFRIPIRQTKKELQCVVKRKESNGRLRCFGSTLKGLDSGGILKEYRIRWRIETGIKDLVENYYFDGIPGIIPHHIDVHYFIVTLTRMLYEMFCKDYEYALNPDKSQKTLDTVRPEFLIGTNATLSRRSDELIVTWNDHYPEAQHHALKVLFSKLNKEMQNGLPFLGGLKLKFDIGSERPKHLQNRIKRGPVEF